MTMHYVINELFKFNVRRIDPCLLGLNGDKITDSSRNPQLRTRSTMEHQE